MLKLDVEMVFSLYHKCLPNFEWVSLIKNQDEMEALQSH